MTRAGPHLAKAPPNRPVAPQQALGICGPDQIRKGHPLNVGGRRRALLEITSQHLMGKLIGDLEPLDQPVANLVVRRLALIAGDAFAEAPHSIAERGGIELHSPAVPYRYRSWHYPQI